MKNILMLLLFLAGCDSPHEENTHLDKISSRNKPAHTPWQIRVPPSWVQKPLPEDLQDTRLPNKEYEIDGNTTMFIHSFPSANENERIPPIAQVQRWKRQFPQEHSVSQVAFSGFSGLLFEGRNQDARVIAFAIGLPSKSYTSVSENSDITIKIVGKTIDLHKEDIIRAARSFELIEAIP